MQKAIISGGAGFIGSHLAEELIKSGFKVIVIDNFSTGRIENLNKIVNNKNLIVVKEDVANFERIKKYFKSCGYVFHLAALADIVPSIVNPLGYHHSNVDGTVSMLEASRLSKVKKFIYTASSSCYGIPDRYPTDEEAPARAQYPYAFTKYAGEQYVMHWAKVYKMPYVSLRLFNVYGPRSRTSGAYGAVFGVFLAQKLAGKKFTIVGDGSQARDFVFVKDVARAFKMAALARVKNEIFNVGSGNPQSINKLVDLLKGEKTYIPKRPGEPDITHADIRKIERMIGWRPEVSFEEGVKIMLSNIDYWKDAPLWTPRSIKNATKDWFKYLT